MWRGFSEKVLWLGAIVGAVMAAGWGCSGAKEQTVFPREAVREALKAEIYGFCPARRDVPLDELLAHYSENKFEGIEPPSDMEWCRKGWLVPGKVGIWWAIDFKQMVVEPAEGQVGENDARMKVTFTGYILTEPLEMDDPVRVESQEHATQILFNRQEKSGSWRGVGFSPGIQFDMF